MFLRLPACLQIHGLAEFRFQIYRLSLFYLPRPRDVRARLDKRKKDFPAGQTLSTAISAALHMCECVCMRVWKQLHLADGQTSCLAD